MKASQLFGAFGGVMVVAATFLAWITVEVGASGVLRSDALASARGIEQTEGKVALIAGMTIVIAAVALIRTDRFVQWAPLVGSAAAILAAVVMFIALVDIQAKLAAAILVGSEVSIGIGVWLTGIGALVALVGFGRAAGGLQASADA
ncbi:MAG TPA: hypothetical protein ENH15_00055 [Actinobacteria bacterium]|nr:hypothetical protein [Actinomycetota bacterium]